MEAFEMFISLCGVLGVSSLINYFVQRHFSRKDEKTRQTIKAQQEAQAARDKAREDKEKKHRQDYEILRVEVEKGLATIRLLSYARVAEEADRLLAKGYATTAERRYLYELNENYKDWGWNGDMKDRMKRVSELPDNPADKTD